MNNYRAMAVFVQVVDSGSFSGAAEKLGITKSAVSQQISLLEEALETRLLHRTTRQLNLTEAGEIYLAGCRQMVEAANAANQEVGQYKKEPSGTVRISCSHDFATRHLVPSLGPFMDRYPKLSLDIDGSEEVINLVEEQVDLAIRIGHINESGWIARKIGNVNEIIVASPEYLKRHGTPRTPADLTNHHWVAFTQKAQPYKLKLLGPNGQKQQIRLYGRASSNSSTTTRAMIKAGMGIGQILQLGDLPEIDTGSLVQVLSDYRSEPIGIFAIYPQRSHMPLKLRATIDYLVENKETLGVAV